MKHVVTGLVLVFLAGGTLAAQSAAQLERIDQLLEEEQYERALSELEALESQASGPGRAEVYWRMSNAVLGMGDLLTDEGAPQEQILATFERGERYADQAIAADPDNPLGYYWKSANIGKWGQTKGIMNSLFKATPMRDLLAEAITRDPEHADSYYVLGQLYAKVPGVISFGNTDYAVSLARRSIDLMDAEVRSGERDEASDAFYVQLASHLISRNWNSRKRNREQDGKANSFRNATTPLERGLYYEGTVRIPNMDDRAEARDILEEVIARLEGMRDPLPSDRRRLTEARELLSGI